MAHTYSDLEAAALRTRVLSVSSLTATEVTLPCVFQWCGCTRMDPGCDSWQQQPEAREVNSEVKVTFSTKASPNTRQRPYCYIGIDSLTSFFSVSLQ